MASGEILDNIIAIESAILSSAPALLIMVFTPAAIPLLSAGTQPIMELVLGEKNIPDPKPMMSINRINSVIDVVGLINIRPPSPTAVISSPTELKILVPYWSDKLPLNGEIIIIAIAKGDNISPAASGSIPFIPWKKKMSKKVTEPLAIPVSYTHLTLPTKRIV